MSSLLPTHPTAPQLPAEEDILRGTIERITFYNEENHYCVMQVRSLQHEGRLTVVGTLPAPQVGQEILGRGRFQTHSKYGNQFRADSLTAHAPTSQVGLKRYLANTGVKGIGEKTAERIIEAFGEQALEAVVETPEKVAAVDGVSESRVRALRDFLLGQRASDQLRRFLIEHELSAGLTERVLERYGKRAVERLKENPYLLSRDLKGIGFNKADTIALNLGTEPQSPKRIEAALLFALNEAEDDGHCYLPFPELMECSASLLGFYEEPLCKQSLSTLERREEVCIDGDRVYRRELFELERYCATEVRRRAGDRTRDFHTKHFAQVIKDAAEALGVEFSEEQRRAAEACFNAKVSVITGGPGCGKTTITRAITQCAHALGLRIALCAPTGRAAQRVSTVCNHPASTIHRLLKFNPSNRQFFHNAQYPLEVDGHEIDMLIVDESSMLDIFLFGSVLEALPESAHLVLVGDKDQLPSVGPGTVLLDLIRSGTVPVSVLSRLYRRDETSRINEVAFAVNAGVVPPLPVPDGQTKSDVYFLERDDPAEALHTIQALCADQIPKKFGIPSREIAVLTPTNRGSLGTTALNQSLQARLNPDAAGIPLGQHELRIGDKICQRVNNYTIHKESDGVFNGDLGLILDIDFDTGSATVELWDGRIVEYQPKHLQQLSLAYATSVHRAQGSEMPCVVLALHTSHYILLERQLLYTAITRAKQLLIIVGSKRAFKIACEKHSSKRRFTALRGLLAD